MEIFIGLGSNVGDRAANVTRALARLGEEGVAIDSVSSLYETEPVDAPSELWFVNAVARGSWRLTSRELLYLCQAIEDQMGRTREIRHGPRTIDLDVLMAGGLVEETLDFTLPHPELHNRRFVLVPFVEIAKDARHPKLGLTLGELLTRTTDRSAVRYFAPPPALNRHAVSLHRD